MVANLKSYTSKQQGKMFRKIVIMFCSDAACKNKFDMLYCYLCYKEMKLHISWGRCSMGRVGHPKILVVWVTFNPNRPHEN